MQDVGDYFGLHYWSRVGEIVRDAHGRSGEASVKTPVPLNGGFVLGRQRFQQRIVMMVGGRTWPDSPADRAKSQSAPIRSICRLESASLPGLTFPGLSASDDATLIPPTPAGLGFSSYPVMI
jgi:hypothetical protein